MFRLFARARIAASGPAGRPARLAAPSSGFTLLELLVVVAIISLLISILLPSLAGARNEGQKTKCFSNMGSLGKAMITYSIDDAKGLTSPVVPQAEVDWLYDGEYEYGGKTGVGVMADPDFQQQNRILNKYMYTDPMSMNASLYECPTDQGVPSAPVNFEPFFLAPPALGKPIHVATGTSYRLNNHIDFVGFTGFTQHFYGPYFRSSTRVPNTAETILLEETIAEVAKWNAPDHSTPGWHGKRNIFNVSFVDGHAGPIRLAGQNNMSANYPNYWVLRGENWRMDCYPDKRIKDRPQNPPD